MGQELLGLSHSWPLFSHDSQLPPAQQSKTSLYPSSGSPGDWHWRWRGRRGCWTTVTSCVCRWLSITSQSQKDLCAFPGALLSNALFVLSSLLVWEPRDLVLVPVLPLACWVTLSKSLALTGPPHSHFWNEEQGVHLSGGLCAGVWACASVCSFSATQTDLRPFFTTFPPRGVDNAGIIAPVSWKMNIASWEGGAE